MWVQALESPPWVADKGTAPALLKEPTVWKLRWHVSEEKSVTKRTTWVC